MNAERQAKLWRQETKRAKAEFDATENDLLVTLGLRPTPYEPDAPERLLLP